MTLSCNSNVCSNTVFATDDDDVNICHRMETNLKLTYESDKGKHAFRDFDKACNNVDFLNTINSNSSLFSANMLFSPSGHCIDQNFDMKCE